MCYDIYGDDMKNKLNKMFGITKNNSSIKVEVFAGIATFLATAYILIANPNNLLMNGTMDPRWASVFIATALGAAIGTFLMGLYAKMPLVQAPGMGINALVGGIIGGTIGIAYSFGNAMLLVFISGIVFLLLSYIKVGKEKIALRELIFDGMPKALRDAISVGIGLFIAFIGLKNAGIINGNDFTLVELVKFNNPDLWVSGGTALKAVVALFGLFVICILSHYKIKGSVIFGILSATILAIPLGVADLDILLGKTSDVTWNAFESFKTFFSFNPESGGTFLSVFTEGFNFPAGSLFTSIILVVSLSMVDMFDTMGTVLACTTNADLNDEDGKPLNYGKIMKSDSLATVIGSTLGTATVTTMVESGAGVAEGGKTGLTAVTTGVLFILSIFLLPLFAFIPSAAAASALIYVGVLMMKNIVNVDLTNIKNAVPAFLTIILMPLTYSITDGIGVGIISYTFINLIIYLIDRIKGKKEKLNLNIVTVIVTILFLIYFLVPMI